MPVEFKELVFSDPRVDEKDGLIWKPVLRAGKWAAGPNGTPLHVIPGRSVDQRKAIGLQDIVDNFDKVDHVTIPLSHADKVDENTGFIRKLAIKNEPDGAVLMAGHDFTEADVKGKVQRGTIANTSVGLEFDYQHKESGSKIPVILRHVALTNRPWINRLKPFGVAASDDTEYEVEALEFAEKDDPDEVAHFSVSAWDSEADIEKIRERIAGKIGDGAKVATMGRDSVLVEKGDKKFVVTYNIDGSDVSVAAPESWVEHISSAPSSTPPAAPAATIPAAPAAPEPPKETTVTDETPEMKALRDQLAAAEATALAEKARGDRLEAGFTTLSEKDRIRDADVYVDNLIAMGLTEEAGFTPFLTTIRDLRLADTGESTVLLSEEGDDTPKPFTVTKIVERLVASLPTDEKTKRFKMALSEQAEDPLGVAPRLRPPRVPVEDRTELAEGTAEFEEHQDELFAAMYPGRSAAAPAAA